MRFRTCSMCLSFRQCIIQQVRSRAISGPKALLEVWDRGALAPWVGQKSSRKLAQQLGTGPVAAVRQRAVQAVISRDLYRSLCNSRQ